MSLANKILEVNRVLQKHMEARGLVTLTADEAAQLVYDAGIIVSAGLPDAPGFAFRDFIREIRDNHGYGILYELLGVTQAGNRPQGRYAFHRFAPPSDKRIEELISSRPATSEKLSSSVLYSLPDYLQEDLDIVFVGTSVAEESARREHYYADPHDRFWDLVNESDLVSDLVGAENDHLILDERCGLTDVVKNLQATDFDIEGFVKKIERSKPKVVAFNGKRAFKEVFAKEPKDHGLSDEIIGDSYVFVLPSSSGTDTSMTYQRKLHWYKKLKAVLRTL